MRQPGFFTAARIYSRLPERFPTLAERPVLMMVEWHRALEKDDTGRQCIRLTDDVIERNSELEW